MAIYSVNSTHNFLIYMEKSGSCRSLGSIRECVKFLFQKEKFIFHNFVEKSFFLQSKIQKSFSDSKKIILF